MLIFRSSQEIHRLLLNKQVHYSILKSHQRINPIHPLQPIL